MFEELLEKDKSFTVHHCNIQKPFLELYKVHNNLSQIIFSDLCVRNHVNYILGSQSDFVIPQVKTVYKGSCSLRFFRPIIWNLIPNKIKYSDSIDNFICKVRQWKPSTCSFRLCKNFIPNVEYIETIR